MQSKKKFHRLIVVLIISSIACAPLRTLFPRFINNQTGVDDPLPESKEQTSIGGEDESPDSILPEDGKPLNIDLVQRGETNSDMIGMEGGTISATADDGSEFELYIPENAIPSPIEISLTPVGTESEEIFKAGTFIGVRMEPDGLIFLTPAELSITSDIGSPEDLRGMASESNGEDANLFLGNTTDNHLIFQVGHFSNIGVVHGSQVDGLYNSWRPSTAQKEAEQKIALLADEYKDDPDQFTISVEHILLDWSKNIETKLRYAMSHSESLDNALADLVTWKRRIQLVKTYVAEWEKYGFGDTLQKRYTELKELASKAILAAIKDAESRCASELDPEIGIEIWRWLVISSILELDDDVVGDIGFPALNGCLNFEFKFEDNMRTFVEDAPARTEVSSTVDIVVKGPEGGLPGGNRARIEMFNTRGQITIDEFDIQNPDLKSRCTFQPEAGEIEVTMRIPMVLGNVTDYRTATPKGHVRIDFTMIQNPKVNATCNVEGQVINMPVADIWFGPFSLNHLEKMQERGTFRFDLPIVRRGEVYAELEESHSLQGVVKENLKMQLIHTPE